MKIKFHTLYILGWVCIAILSYFWTPYNPYMIQPNSVLEGPSLAHWLGTDALGRDTLSRIMAGSTVTVFVSLLASCTTMVLGICIGLTSGYFGGIYDRIVQIVVAIFQSIPSISFMIALAGILEPSISTIVLAITVTSWVNFSRIIRSEVISLKDSNYVIGIRHMGASRLYILSTYIVRAILPTIVVLFTTRVGYTMLSMSALSFIGLGIQPPLADWGSLVQEGYTYFRTYPALLYAPGICLVSVGIAVHYMGAYINEHYAQGGSHGEL